MAAFSSRPPLLPPDDEDDFAVSVGGWVLFACCAIVIAGFLYNGCSL